MNLPTAFTIACRYFFPAIVSKRGSTAPASNYCAQHPKMGRRDRPGQSRAISTNFKLLPIKGRAVSAQKLELAVRFSTSGTGATTCSHWAQRGLKQPRLHLTRHHERPASVHSIPTPFAPTSIEAGASRPRLGIAKASDRIFAPHTATGYVQRSVSPTALARLDSPGRNRNTCAPPPLSQQESLPCDLSTLNSPRPTGCGPRALSGHCRIVGVPLAMPPIVGQQFLMDYVEKVVYVNHTVALHGRVPIASEHPHAEATALPFCIKSEITREERYQERMRTAEPRASSGL